jgi:HEPN domain-containing protein
MDAKRSLVHNWIMKARRDLLSAKRLARGSVPYLDTAIYHCQQAVEKAVKGWLIYNDQSLEKIHDLRLLVGQAFETEDKFADWLDVARTDFPLCDRLPLPWRSIGTRLGRIQSGVSSCKQVLRFYLFHAST